MLWLKMRGNDVRDNEFEMQARQTILPALEQVAGKLNRRKGVFTKVSLGPARDGCLLEIGWSSPLRPRKGSFVVKNDVDAPTVRVEEFNHQRILRAQLLPAEISATRIEEMAMAFGNAVLTEPGALAAAEEIIEESRSHSLGDITIDELLDEGRRG
jgi:hypothetical protein